MNKHLIIRADATTQIGTGHVMRCIALAQAWQDRGGHVTFISNCESEGLRQRISDEGFGLIPVENSYPDPFDLEKTLSILSHEKDNADWLVLDGYHFDTDYQKTIRDNGFKLLVIDDMNHLPHYHADILLNQNIHAPKLKYSCDNDTILLIGCKYVMLRREFLEYREYKRIIPKKASKIMVTMGGSDPDNVTLKVVQALNHINDDELEVKFVVGPVNPYIDSIKKELSSSNFAYSILYNVKNMPELMLWADVAISAAGSTCWELAFMGLPNLMFILAQNQEAAAIELDRYKIGVNLGWHDKISNSQISSTILNLINDEDLYHKISKKGKALIDGKGYNRIVGLLYK